MLPMPHNGSLPEPGQSHEVLTNLQAKMGVRVVVLDPTVGCPASTVATQIVGSFRDPGAVKQIAQTVSSRFYRIAITFSSRE